MRALGFIAFIALAACTAGTHSTHGTDAPDVDGDPAAAELAIAYRSRAGLPVVATAGDAVPLEYPPQGGLVILVGARAKHLGTNVTLTASLRDTVDPTHVLAVEMRPVELAPDVDGWEMPEQPDSFVNWANLPTCPTAGAARDLDGQPWTLRIAAADDAGKHAETTLSIVPTCEAGTAGDLCRCMCAHDYVLGDPCP